MSEHKYDAAVVGAGPSGSSLAIRLASGGLRVALIDKAPLGRDRVCGGFLGWEAGAVLERLGIPEALSKAEARPVHHLILSGPGTPEIEAPLGVKGAHGWGVNRQIFDRYLAEEAVRRGVDFFPETTVEKKERSAGGALLHLKEKRNSFPIQAALVVSAIGRRLPPVTTSQTFFACRAAYSGMAGMRERVVLHFVRGGHVGINQRSEGTTNLCLYVQQQRIKEAGGNLDRMMEQFSEENKAIRYHLQHASRITDWQGCAAQPDSRPLFYDGYSFFSGDAVTMVNPIIGGGLAIAMGSSAILAEEVLSEGPSAHEKIFKGYKSRWQRNYAQRLLLGRFLGWCEKSVKTTSWVLKQMSAHTALLNQTILFSRPKLRVET